MLTFIAAATAVTSSLLLGGMLLVAGVSLYLYGEEVAEYLEVDTGAEVIEHIEPGLTDKEVEEFAILHDEYLTIKEEKREEMQKKYKNQGPSTGHLNKR